MSVLEDWSAQFTRGRPLPEGQGADVTTTFDAVDTGERRRAGRYVARRVRTTVTVEPSPGANTPASTRETDGWYIDLPGLGCSDTATTAYLAVGEVVGPGGLRDRHHYRTKGAASRGYAIEETNRFTQAGGTNVDRVELIELSEHPLDLSLFDIPRDYRPALPLVRGGYDMTKPDTLANRLQVVLGRAHAGRTRDLSLTMAAIEPDLRNAAFCYFDPVYSQLRRSGPTSTCGESAVTDMETEEAQAAITKGASARATADCESERQGRRSFDSAPVRCYKSPTQLRQFQHGISPEV